LRSAFSAASNAALEIAGELEVLRGLVAAGEEARTLADVPLKAMIADRHLALIPLRLEEPGLEGGLLVHPSPLLQALTTLFEALWERAAPLRFVGESIAAGDGPLPALTADDERLLALLSAGVKDEAIARQLGVGLRTVERQVRRLMDAVHVRTRFQLGQAVERSK
jgi:DNA-binding CsgD family transcriptional regulator